MLVVGALLTAATGLIWSWAAGGSYFHRTGFAGMIIAALPVVTGGTEFSGRTALKAQAFLGLDVNRERRSGYTGRHLTLLGTALFVSAPLFLVSSLIYTL
jgi:hypothetical protein